MNILQIKNISKQFAGEAEPALSDFSLNVEAGEILVLLGESGCGKTTVLKTVAGLLRQDAGSVYIDGACMDEILPERRPISMVFQKALLFNNMTVLQNVEFAPKVNHIYSTQELHARSQKMLELVGLENLKNKRATELSGGQEQRVSLARALMIEPKLLLLDEPFSALDASLRESMQLHVREINEKTKTTMLMVTHDQHEAASMATRIAVMHEGRIIQVGQPQDFYTLPKTRYVASFFGWKNLLCAHKLPEACVEADDTHGSATVECALGRVHAARASCENESGVLAIRPEACVPDSAGQFSGRIANAIFEGTHIRYFIECEQLNKNASSDPNYLEFHLPINCGLELGATFSFNIDERMCAFIEDDHAQVL